MNRTTSQKSLTNNRYIRTYTAAEEELKRVDAQGQQELA
jgi:hypothetical protein